MTQEQSKKTKTDLVEEMKRLYVEIGSINEQIAMIKEKAKELGMDATLMAKVAKSLADFKVDEVLAKNDEFANLVEEVRS